MRVLLTAIGLSLALAVSALAQRDVEHGRHLARYGLSITLPAGWHGTIYRRAGGLPIIHAANFRLPSGDDDAGTRAIKRMGAASALLVLMESPGARGFTWRRLTETPRVTRRDFLPLFKGVPPEHAFARVLFTTSRRYFQLWVQFGARPAPAHLLEKVNRVLRTLAIAPAKGS